VRDNILQFSIYTLGNYFTLFAAQIIFMVVA
jgi:hypothetical protein